jgi:hypothetical protein
VLPDTRVFVEFNIDLVDVEFFTLDDATKGLLNGTYPLGGDVLVDVTQYVTSVSIDRGKSRQLDRFTSGQATVTFHNDNRYFDPFFTDSPYFQQFVPKRQVVIEANGVRQFTGEIDDIDLTYNLGNKSFATITCSDAFALISNTELTEFTTSSQFSGQRIEAILSRPEVNWPIAERDIDTGQQLLQADTVADNTNTLTYLQTVEQSEPGSLFISKDGLVTFKDRTNFPPLIETIAFADDNTPNGVSYNNIEVSYGSENLYNRVTITRANGTAQTADSVASQSLFGIQALSLDGLLMVNDADALSIAGFLVDKFELPELRFAALGFTLHDKTETVANAILSLEINDAVRVRFTPNNIGDPISEFALITGISHNIGIDQYNISFEFGEVTNFPFILDDTTYGVLAGNLPLYDSSTTAYDDPVKYDGTLNETYPLAF